jgi:translation initiation factor IF-2
MEPVDNQKETNQSTLLHIELPLSMTVKQLADALKVEPVKVIKQLMRKGIMVNINQSIDFDTAARVASDFDYRAQEKIEPRVTSSSLSGSYCDGPC